jgi:hypothetical protein
MTFYGVAVGRLNELGEARRLRVLASQLTIPPPLWVLLIGGGVFTIAWLLPFHMADTRIQTWALGTVGAFTGFVLFLVYALQHPFAGDVAIDAGCTRVSSTSGGAALRDEPHQRLAPVPGDGDRRIALGRQARSEPGACRTALTEAA